VEDTKFTSAVGFASRSMEEFKREELHSNGFNCKLVFRLTVVDLVQKGLCVAVDILVPAIVHVAFRYSRSS
jgi:hypothetical protein